MPDRRASLLVRAQSDAAKELHGSWKIRKFTQVAPKVTQYMGGKTAPTPVQASC